jgi:hypothetical protein
LYWILKISQKFLQEKLKECSNACVLQEKNAPSIINLEIWSLHSGDGSTNLDLGSAYQTIKLLSVGQAYLGDPWIRVKNIPPISALI